MLLTLELITFDRGIHLRGTPLWFDAATRRELCVVTSLPSRQPPVHQRIAASPAMAVVLKRSGYKGTVLPVPWGRWIGMGGQMVQLLDVQSPLGGAAGLVLHGGKKYLITGTLRSSPAFWPRAEELIAHVPALLLNGQPLPEAIAQLNGFLRRAAQHKARGRVVVDCAEAAMAVINGLVAAGWSAKPVGLLARLMGAAASGRGGISVSLMGQRLPTTGWVARVWTRPSAVTKLDDAATQLDLPLQWLADLKTLKTLAAATGVLQLTLIGVEPQIQANVVRALRDLADVRFLDNARQLLLWEQLAL